MLKAYANNIELQQKTLAGVNKLADNVAVTLGPKGRNVILHKKGKNPIVTKDGVTVANFVDLEDPFENAAAQILKQVASETNALAGDGTTTSTVLARDILKNSQRYLMAGSSPVELKRGMDSATTVILNKLKEVARPVESFQEVEYVATISANGDEAIGKLIASAAEQAGSDGSILVQDAKSLDTSLEVLEGFRMDSGYFAQAFVTNERNNSIVYEDLLLLVTDHKIDDAKALLPVLELVAREGKPFIIVAEQVEGQALAALIMNAVRGTMKVAAAKAPGYGSERTNILKDLCLATGATFISRSSGKKLSEVVLSDLGCCDKIEILKNNTTIMGGQADWEEIDKKIESLKSEIKQTEDLGECRKLQKRISRLNSAVSVIKVGGATEIEMIERKHRIEDALAAVKSAQDQGVLPGGGISLLQASNFEVESENEDQALGVAVIKKSLEAPVRQMARNAGQSADVIVEKIRACGDPGYGWDFKTNELVDMMDKGIMDPAKVTMTALKNAVSAASTLITTSNGIVEIK